jgi:nitrate/nitrite transport system permease protein
MQMLSVNKRAALLSVVLLIVALGAWEISVTRQVMGEALTEYEILMGVGQPRAAVPPPSDVIIKAWEQLSNPFYDNGQ